MRGRTYQGQVISAKREACSYPSMVKNLDTVSQSCCKLSGFILFIIFITDDKLRIVRSVSSVYHLNKRYFHIFICNNKFMSTFRSRHQHSFTFKNRSSQLIVKEINDIASEHIISQQQQDLVETYSRARKNDLRKEQEIKKKIINNFIEIDAKSTKKDFLTQMKQSLNLNDIGSIELRNKVTTQMQKSFSGSKTARRRTAATPVSSSRYQNQNSYKTQSLNRKKIENSNEMAKSINICGQSMFSVQLDSIITQSRRLKPKVSKNNKIVTATERHRQSELDFNNQRKFMVSKIIENDIDEYLKSYELAQELPDPEKMKEQYELNRSMALSNLQKYNMSFTNYMRQKTYGNIERTIYNDKIRRKESFLEKFQHFVLTQLKFSDEVRRRLEKIFKNIELQFMQHTNKRQNSSKVIK